MRFITPKGCTGGGSPREGGIRTTPCRRPFCAIASVLEGSRYRNTVFLCNIGGSRPPNFHKRACQIYSVFVCFRLLRHDFSRFCRGPVSGGLPGALLPVSGGLNGAIASVLEGSL